MEERYPEYAEVVTFDRTDPSAAVRSGRARVAANLAAECSRDIGAQPNDPGAGAEEAVRKVYFEEFRIYTIRRHAKEDAVKRFRACKGFVIGTLSLELASRVENNPTFQDGIAQSDLGKIWIGILATVNPAGAVRNRFVAESFLDLMAIRQRDDESIVDFIDRYRASRDAVGRQVVDQAVESVLVMTMLNARADAFKNFASAVDPPVTNMERLREAAAAWYSTSARVPEVGMAAVAASTSAEKGKRPPRRKEGERGRQRREPTCFACGSAAHRIADCPLMAELKAKQGSSDTSRTRRPAGATAMAAASASAEDYFSSDEEEIGMGLKTSLDLIP